jgi:hypothetical protein
MCAVRRPGNAGLPEALKPSEGASIRRAAARLRRYACRYR